jgi:hypothetical protein
VYVETPGAIQCLEVVAVDGVAPPLTPARRSRNPPTLGLEFTSDAETPAEQERSRRGERP